MINLKYRVNNNNYRAKQYKYPYNLHEHDIQYLLNYFDYKCAYCDCELGIDFNIDHIVSLSNSEYMMHPGSTLSNIVVCCPECNSSKGSKNWEEWVTERFDNPDEIIEKIEFYIVANE